MIDQVYYSKEFMGMKYPFDTCARKKLHKLGKCLECSVRQFCKASEKKEVHQ